MECCIFTNFVHNNVIQCVRITLAGENLKIQMLLAKITLFSQIIQTNSIDYLFLPRCLAFHIGRC